MKTSDSSAKSMNMRSLLMSAMSDAIVRLDAQIPQTKKQVRSISIMNVKPIELLQFMKDNGIPDDACFDGRDNGYDAWDDILLSWDVDVPTTDSDKLAFKKKRFTDIAWMYVYQKLTANGYIRQGVNSHLLKQFDDTTIYDMYMNVDWDRIELYYSLRFVQPIKSE